MKVLKAGSQLYGHYFVRNNPAISSGGFYFTSAKNASLVIGRLEGTKDVHIEGQFIKVVARFATTVGKTTTVNYNVGWLKIEVVQEALFVGENYDGLGGDNDGSFSPMQKGGIISIAFGWWLLLFLPFAYYLFRK